MKECYKEYMFTRLKELTDIPSPTGYYKEMQHYLVQQIELLGYEPTLFNRGGFSVDLGGEGNTLAVTAHFDDIGLSVRYIDSSGRLHLDSIGGLYAPNTHYANVKVITRNGRKYSGTVQRQKSCVHHMASINDVWEKLEFDKNLVVILDEFVTSKEDVSALGICNGDFVALDTNYMTTEKGFIKSRFLDDKSCVAVLLTYMKYLKEEEITLSRKIVAHFSAFEENGTDGATGMPDQLRELIALDKGLVGEWSDAREDKVSICVRDARGHYTPDVVDHLVTLAEENNLDFSIDCNMPAYGSDTHPAICAGNDIKHACFGPGVMATHGYERTHQKGMVNTLELLMLYAK